MASCTLAILDGRLPPAYIRYALIFACNPNWNVAAIARLQRKIEEMVSEIRMPACKSMKEDRDVTIATSATSTAIFGGNIKIFPLLAWL